MTFIKRKTISEQHRKNLSESRKGSKNPNWKGGRRSHSEGYILILNKNHPFCNKSGYVLEHRLVMEKHIGRYLKPEERVHHINGIKKDNRIKNLICFPSESIHQKSHHKKILSSIIETGKRKCSCCEKILPISNFYKCSGSPFYISKCKLCKKEMRKNSSSLHD